MIRNWGHDGVMEGRGYNSGGDREPLGTERGGKTTRKTIDRIKTSRGVAGDGKREDEDSDGGYSKIIQ